MYHRHALFAHAAGGGFQIQLCRHRDDEDEVVLAVPLRHQRLVDAGRVFADAGGDSHAVHGHALFVGIFMRGVGHLGPLQNAHGVGFCFFAHM